MQLDQYQHIKNINVSMGHQYLHSARWENKIVANLNIYGARAILLIFCDNQDTDYE